MTELLETAEDWDWRAEGELGRGGSVSRMPQIETTGS